MIFQYAMTAGEFFDRRGQRPAFDEEQSIQIDTPTPPDDDHNDWELINSQVCAEKSLIFWTWKRINSEPHEVEDG